MWRSLIRWAQTGGNGGRPTPWISRESCRPIAMNILQIRLLLPPADRPPAGRPPPVRIKGAEGRPPQRRRGRVPHRRRRARDHGEPGRGVVAAVSLAPPHRWRPGVPGGRDLAADEGDVLLPDAAGGVADGEVVERVPLRSCVRGGAATEVVDDRARENRSQLVFTRGRGRDMVFWQSPRTVKQARPKVALPTARPTAWPTSRSSTDGRKAAGIGRPG